MWQIKFRFEQRKLIHFNQNLISWIIPALFFAEWNVWDTDPSDKLITMHKMNEFRQKAQRVSQNIFTAK